MLRSRSPRLESLEDRFALSTLSITDVSHREGNVVQVGNGPGATRHAQATAYSFEIKLSGPVGHSVRVNYATANGTATAANRDYLAKSGTVAFAAGETRKVVTVIVLGDNTKEANEKFFVHLSKAQGAGIADSKGVGTILNNDGSGAGHTTGDAVFTAMAKRNEFSRLGRGGGYYPRA